VVGIVVKVLLARSILAIFPTYPYNCSIKRLLFTHRNTGHLTVFDTGGTLRPGTAEIALFRLTLAFIAAVHKIDTRRIKSAIFDAELTADALFFIDISYPILIKAHGLIFFRAGVITWVIGTMLARQYNRNKGMGASFDNDPVITGA
jgi:hypothetical protein